MEKNIKKNIIYNILLQIFNISFPFLTSTYISRSLGSEKLGIVNYSQSVFNCILVISLFGIQTYGIREIAKVRDDKSEMSKVYSELIVIRFFTTILALIVYVLIINNFYIFEKEILLYRVTMIAIIFNVFNVDWFYGGIENYKLISLRNIIIKIITFIAIVIFIKTEKDYFKYALLLILSQGISNFWSYLVSKKIVEFNYKNINLKRHLSSLGMFFLSTFIISCYTTLNNIILGWYSLPEQLAYFVRARGILAIGISLTGAVATVLVPRISYYYNNDRVKYYELLNKSLNFNYIISIPLFCGLFILSKSINFIFGGEQFVGAAISLKIISPLIIILTLGTWMYFQIIIPLGKEKIGTIIQGIMAGVSLLSTFILVPSYKEIGASIALLITETIGPIISFYILRKSFNFKIITSSLWKYILASTLMSVVLYYYVTDYKEYLLFFKGILLGGMIYLLCLIVLKEKIILEVINFFKNKVSKYNFK